MMRYSFRIVCVVALSALFELGCGEAIPIPEPELKCVDNVCPCNEDGIRAAIAEGDGRYTFDCDGPTTVVTKAEIVIDNDVTLDGEDNLTVDGADDHRVFSVPEGVTAELGGLEVTRGFAFGDEDNHGGGIHNEGTMTLTDCALSGNSAEGRGGGIHSEGTMTVTNSTVSGNRAEERGGGISNQGTMSVTNSTVSGNSGGGDRDCRTDQVDLMCYEGGGIWSDGTLTIINSTVSGNTAHFGGGIANGPGTLTMMDSTVSENAAAGCRVVALCSSGGGLWNSGTLAMTDSTVSGNTATAGGGGISNRGVPTLTNSTVSENSAGRDGGGILNFAQLTITNSTVSGNNAGQSGGGIANAGDMLAGDMLRVTSSTVSGNTAVAAGGAIINRSNADAEITNSTLSGNTAEIWGGGIWNVGELRVASSTVATNAAPTASGIYDAASPDMGSVSVSGTLIEGDCGDTLLESNGYNIESPADTCGFDQVGDQADVTADQLNLGPLQDNGGPTETHALQTVPVASAAIDQIPQADCLDGGGDPLSTDQRGQPRPAGAASECDVGAFEAQR